MNIVAPKLKNLFVITFAITLGVIICIIGAFIIQPFWGIT